MSGRILIVEDEALVALTMEEVLLDAGYQVCGVAEAPNQAIELARLYEPDLAVVDVRLAAGGDGIALADRLAAMGPVAILFATANCAEVRSRARAGQGCLSKPFQAGWLLAALDAVRTGAEADIPGFFSLPFGRTPS